MVLLRGFCLSPEITSAGLGEIVSWLHGIFPYSQNPKNLSGAAGDPEQQDRFWYK